MNRVEDRISLIPGQAFRQLGWAKKQQISHLKLHHIIELANEIGYPDQWMPGCTFKVLMESCK